MKTIKDYIKNPLNNTVIKKNVEFEDTGLKIEELSKYKNLNLLDSVFPIGTELEVVNEAIVHKKILSQIQNFLEYAEKNKDTENVPSLYIYGKKEMGKKRIAQFIQSQLKQRDMESIIDYDLLSKNYKNEDEIEIVLGAKSKTGQVLIMPVDSGEIGNKIMRNRPVKNTFTIELKSEHYLSPPNLKNIIEYFFKNEGYDIQLNDEQVKAFNHICNTSQFSIKNLKVLIDDVIINARTNNEDNVLDFINSINNNLPKKSKSIVFPLPVRLQIDSFIENCLLAKKNNSQSPVLILTGNKGLGKRTLVNYLSQLESQDIYVYSQVVSLEELLSGNNILSSFVDVSLKSFEKNLVSNPMVLIIDKLITEENINAFNVAIKDLNSITYVQTIHLNPSIYENDFLFQELFEEILISHGCNLSSKSIDRLFPIILKKIPTKTPNQLDSVIKPIVSKALLRNEKLNFNFFLTELSDMPNFKPQKYNSFGAIVSNRKVKLEDTEYDYEFQGKLKEFIYSSKNASVMEKYEFMNKLSPNGIMSGAILYGESGTGKSLACEVVASELEKPLWSVDISKITGMYVGETEKALTSIFHEAEKRGVVLRIDEVASFMQSRESASASYEKRWVSHLLNLMEDFRGIIIVTDNNFDKLDPAFMRRFKYRIEVKVPDIKQMKSMIMKMLYPDAPLCEGFDINKALIGVSPMSGGFVKNAIENCFKKALMVNNGIINEQLLNEALLNEKKGTNVRAKIGLSGNK